MPPPVEDTSGDESGGDIPFSTAKTDTQDQNGDKTSDQDDDDEQEEGIYVVESIAAHDFLDDGTLTLHVKWKGYEDEKDMTWEPEENLKDGAHDVLAAYYRKIGGRPKKPIMAPAKSGPGRKRKSIGDAKASPAPKPETKKRRKSAVPETPAETPKKAESDSEDEATWVPKGKNWDKEVDLVDTLSRDPETEVLFALLKWKNGKLSRVAAETCYDRCPRKMLEFYEQHLVFKDN
ncbi:hypothetical protein N7490_003126 [Penicillium lividum]|nr:hypothetical protein N7490_003126 [Penicillium lividum]